MVFIVFYMSLASDELGGVLGGDNARYLMLARSLAEHQSYCDWYLPGAPAHTQYPFLFPLLLSAFAQSSRQVFYSHLLIQFIASLVPLLLCGWARLSGMSRLKSLLVFFLAGSLPAWYSSLLNLLTEPVFMFFMMLSLLLLAHLKKRGADICWSLLLALSVLASAMVREAGLVLFAALFLGMLLERTFREKRAAGMPLWVILGAVFLAGYAGWSVRNFLAGGGGFYFKQFLQKNPYAPQQGMLNFSDFMARLKVNLWLHLPHIGGFAFPSWLFPYRSPGLWLSVFFFALIALGLVSRMRARNFFAELTFLALFAMAMVWFFQEERFSLPVLPLAVYYFIHGLDSLAGFLRSKSQAITLGIGLLLVLWQMGLMAWLCAKYHDQQMYPEAPVQVEGYGEWKEPVLDASQYSIYWKFPEEFWEGTADWIVLQKVAGRILPEDAMVACRKPTLAWYFMNRKAAWYEYQVSPEEQWKNFRKNRITHIFISSSNRELVEMVRAYPENFKFLAAIPRSGLEIAQVEYPRE